jgi:hypothetical protein
MTDLFADFVTDDMLDRIFAVMALCPQHVFQVLTKRPERMRRYLSLPGHARCDAIDAAKIAGFAGRRERFDHVFACDVPALPNVSATSC